MRDNEIEVYFTLNTGKDVHLICMANNAQLISERVRNVEGVKHTIINTPSNGTVLSENHSVHPLEKRIASLSRMVSCSRYWKLPFDRHKKVNPLQIQAKDKIVV